MNDYLVDMFKIPLLHLEVENWNDKKKILKDLFDISLYKNTEPDEQTTDYFYKVESGNKDKDLETIRSLFSPEIEKFRKCFSFEDVEMLVSWFEMSMNGQHHEVHNHGATGYSAVCFIDFDKKYHKPTNFVSPFNDFYKGNTLTFEPPNIHEGSLIFFPSCIHHYAPANHSNIPRMIISFNLKVR